MLLGKQGAFQPSQRDGAAAEWVLSAAGLGAHGLGAGGWGCCQWVTPGISSGFRSCLADRMGAGAPAREGKQKADSDAVRAGRKLRPQEGISRTL